MFEVSWKKFRLDSQETRVRSKTALEQLEETGFELETVLETLSQHETEDNPASSKQWQEKIDRSGC